LLGAIDGQVDDLFSLAVELRLAQSYRVVQDGRCELALGAVTRRVSPDDRENAIDEAFFAFVGRRRFERGEPALHRNGETGLKPAREHFSFGGEVAVLNLFMEEIEDGGLAIVGLVTRGEIADRIRRGIAQGSGASKEFVSKCSEIVMAERYLFGSPSASSSTRPSACARVTWLR
jgi:hypothetical protein